MSKFVWAGFFIFVLVFVSRDFEVGRIVSCEESTVSPVYGANSVKVILEMMLLMLMQSGGEDHVTCST